MNLGMARQKLGDGDEVPDPAAARELVDAALRAISVGQPRRFADAAVPQARGVPQGAIGIDDRIALQDPPLALAYVTSRIRVLR